MLLGQTTNVSAENQPNLMPQLPRTSTINITNDESSNLQFLAQQPNRPNRRRALSNTAREQPISTTTARERRYSALDESVLIITDDDNDIHMGENQFGNNLLQQRECLNRGQIDNYNYMQNQIQPRVDQMQAQLQQNLIEQRWQNIDYPGETEFNINSQVDLGRQQGNLEFYNIDIERRRQEQQLLDSEEQLRVQQLFDQQTELDRRQRINENFDREIERRERIRQEETLLLEREEQVRVQQHMDSQREQLTQLRRQTERLESIQAQQTSGSRVRQIQTARIEQPISKQRLRSTLGTAYNEEELPMTLIEVKWLY